MICRAPTPTSTGSSPSPTARRGRAGETRAAVVVLVGVEYGVSIVEVANAIRRNIIEQIEGTTGLEVVEVNIDVTDVHLPDDDSTSADSADLK